MARLSLRRVRRLIGRPTFRDEVLDWVDDARRHGSKVVVYEAKTEAEALALIARRQEEVGRADQSV